MSKSSPDSDTDKGDGHLKKTLSVDSLAPTLTSFFRKRKRSASSSDSDRHNSSDSGSDSDSDEASVKKRKVEKSKAQEEFERRDKQYEAELPEHLRKFRPKGHKFNLPPTDRPVRIYADGVFDLFHLGHMRQLEQAKKSFENVELVCGIPSDKETHKRKGLTVLTDKQRIDTLKHCRWVDEVIPDAPWCVTADFLLKHKIDYVAHDDLPYASADSDDIYKPIKERGMFLTTQRTEGISTSDIITKIIRDYDKYLMRNFARGATRKELNVSWLKKNELDFKKHINDFRTYWVRNKANINNVSKDLYFEVREYLRGKKSELPFNLANHLPHSNSTPSLVSDSDEASRGSSPLTEFASKYIVNKNEKPGRSLFKGFNLNSWISRDESHDEESAEERKSNSSASMKTTMSAPVAPLSPRKIKRPRSRKQH
ncbi:hypothetical protein CJJ07_003294 [Candidozyma auris]|nr:hypothetical protein CJJ07_003294 [[Candida] auris]QEL62826.1 hypothetical protein CJJ09_005007 [[Candida] auris]